MGVLSIQSRVAYGCVGQSAAQLPLQRLGLEVWPVDTVRFSNHPGYGSWTGRVLEAGEVADIIGGIGARGVFGECEAVLSGYLGSAETGQVVLDAVAAVRRENPDALYLCDPVMGDHKEGLYVPEPVRDFFCRHALPAADVITPNAFELSLLSGRPVTGPHEAADAARVIMSGGRPGVVVATSVPGDGRRLDTVCVTRRAAWAVSTPRLSLSAKGAGDVFSALFLGHYLKDRNPRRAVAGAVSSLFGILRQTALVQADELFLTRAQDEITNPKELFSARELD